jgi:hypothetical protein
MPLGHMALGSLLGRIGQTSKLVGFLNETIGKARSELMGLALIEAMIGDQSRKETAIDPARHIVAGRDGEIGAGIVVEPN